MAKTPVNALPEVTEIQDDDLLVCSVDKKHIQTVKAKNVKGMGGGSGGLSYWKESSRALYKDTNTDPTEMNAIVVRKEGGLIDGNQWDYYEVFGHKFGFQVPVEGEASYASLERARKFALRNALSMASSSTDGHAAQPTNYTMPNVYSVSGTDHYTSQYSFNLPDRFSPYATVEQIEEEATQMNSLSFAYLYPGPNSDIYKMSRSNIYCGYITLDMFNADGDIAANPDPLSGEPGRDDCDAGLGYSNTVLKGSQDIDNQRFYKLSPVGQASTYYNLRGIYAERSRDNTWGNYDHMDVRFMFFLICCGKNYADSDDPDDYTVDTTEFASYGLNFESLVKEKISTGSGYIYQYAFGSEAPTWMVRDGQADAFVRFRDRTRNMSCSFIDDNGVKWNFIIGYDPDCEKAQNIGGPSDPKFPPVGNYESTYPDFTLPNGVQNLDLGYIPHHPCYYEGANPVDENGELSDASHEIYKQNMVDLGKAVKEALGLVSTPAVLEGEIPGGISYKVRTELVNDSENVRKVFSAGTVDGEDNYTETISMDAVEGDILLNNQSIKQMIAGSVEVTPVLQQGTKIAIINQNDIFAPTPTDVAGNPPGTATTDLEKLQIGNDIYKIPTGGGGSYSTDPVKVGEWIDGRPVYEFTYVASITANGNFSFQVPFSGTGVTFSNIKSVIFTGMDGGITFYGGSSRIFYPLQAKLTGQDENQVNIGAFPRFVITTENSAYKIWLKGYINIGGYSYSSAEAQLILKTRFVLPTDAGAPSLVTT